MAHINDLKKEIEEKYGVLPKGIVEDIYKRAGEREVRRINWLKGRDERSKMFDSFGGFHFNSYEDVLQLKMRKQFLTRFIFVCTNMNYNNKVVFGNPTTSSNNLIFESLSTAGHLRANSFLAVKGNVELLSGVEFNTCTNTTNGGAIYVEGELVVKGASSIITFAPVAT